jgi:hypothetical protein
MTAEQWFQLGLVAIGAVATILGALLGALGGAVYQARQSRPRLRVKATLGFPVIGGNPGPTTVTVSAANVGPLPMQVVGFGFALSTRHTITLTDDAYGLTSLPVDLPPGRSADMRIFHHRLIEALQEQADVRRTPLSVTRAWARDGTGTEWRGRVLIKGLRARPRRT